MDGHDKETLFVDEKLNALDFLLKFDDFFGRALDDRSYWKWSIISLHASIYSFCIIFLRFTDATAFTVKDKRRKSIKKPLDQTFINELHLISLTEAIEQCCNEGIANLLNNQALNLQKTELEALKELNRLRNDFMHFKPQHRMVYFSLMVDVIRESLSVLAKIVESTRELRYRGEHLEKIRKVIDVNRERIKVYEKEFITDESHDYMFEN